MTALPRSPTSAPATNISRAERIITTKVVSTLDERQMVVAVRAAVYLGKPGWDYAHTFDANDHCASHLLTLVNHEPAGTVRVRWFANFARIERIAVMPEFRSLACLNSLARGALRLCRKKGYDRVGGLAYPELVNFWRRHGGTPCGDVIHNELGALIPILLIPKEWPDIEPLDLSNVGTPEFELRAFAWEGASV
jgi:hypothetical protein